MWARSFVAHVLEFGGTGVARQEVETADRLFEAAAWLLTQSRRP